MDRRSLFRQPNFEERVEAWRSHELRALEWLVREQIIVEAQAFPPRSQLSPPKKYLFSSVFAGLSETANTIGTRRQPRLESWGRFRDGRYSLPPGGFVDLARYISQEVDRAGRSRDQLAQQTIALLGVALSHAEREQGYALLQPMVDQDAAPRAAQVWRGMSLQWVKEPFLEIIKPQVLTQAR